MGTLTRVRFTFYNNTADIHDRCREILQINDDKLIDTRRTRATRFVSGALLFYYCAQNALVLCEKYQDSWLYHSQKCWVAIVGPRTCAIVGPRTCLQLVHVLLREAYHSKGAICVQYILNSRADMFRYKCH